jgi:hypothetical protein
VTDGDSLRFVPGDAGFERRSGLVDSLLAHWTIVAGTGSWLDAHLLARLGRALGWPNLRGCGISEQEVLQLLEAEDGDRPLLLILIDSIAADHGCDLILRLRRQRPDVQVLLLVQHDRGDWLEALRDACSLAIVHVESFGSGTTSRRCRPCAAAPPSSIRGCASCSTSRPPAGSLDASGKPSRAWPAAAATARSPRL